MNDQSKEKMEKDRDLRIVGAQFAQCAEVARLAVELAYLGSTKPEEELHHAWQLIESARDIVAPIMSELEVAMREMRASGGSAEALKRGIAAVGKAEMIPYDTLISEPGEKGQQSVTISYSSFDEESCTDIPQTAEWKKLAAVGFRKAVAQFVRHSCADSRKKIVAQLTDRKPPTEWFQRGPRLPKLLDAVEKVCGDIPIVARLAKDARRAIKEATEHPNLTEKAERIVFKVIHNARLHESNRQKRVVDQWEKDARTDWEKEIMRQLQERGALPLALVLQINESRHRARSERSQAGAATKRKRHLRR